MGNRNRASANSKEFDLLLETISEVRQRAGLSQREVARRLGFHPTVYGKIERGERAIDVVEFVHLANVIGVDPLEMLGEYVARLSSRED